MNGKNFGKTKPKYVIYITSDKYLIAEMRARGSLIIL